MTDVNAEITLAKNYAPYGETMSSAGNGASPFAYTGEQTDSNGLVYLRARYYSPNDGRFQSRDTWDGDSSNPMSFNRWNYVEGNPVNLTDPSGHDPWWCEKTQNPAACYYQWILAHTGLSGTLTAIQCASIMSDNIIELGDFLITHYYLPMEDDPYFQTVPYSHKVAIKISDPNGPGKDTKGPYHWGEPRRYNFMFGPLGVAKQGGTGITDTGRYIAPDWIVDDPQGNVDDYHFVYTKGGSCRDQGLRPITGETVAADLSSYPCGTQFMIDEYPGTIFTVADAGNNVRGKHLDIYIGALFYSQYKWITKTHFTSTVRRLK